MGNCASPQCAKKVGGDGHGGGPNWSSTAKVIHKDGRLQEFRQPIKASHILSSNPNSFLCNSECMYIDCHLPPVPDDEELQLGQLYFLMPLSKSHSLLSLPELCALAHKASSSLARSDMGSMPPEKKLPYLDKNGTKILASDQHYHKVPVSINIVGSRFLVKRDKSKNWVLKLQN